MRNYEEPWTKDGKNFLAIGVELDDGTKFEASAELGTKISDRVIAILREKRDLFVSKQLADTSVMPNGLQFASDRD